ncbi:factor-independent urate hydroxylase [Granulicella paludicola]|uniref:factor-independent urate hydroxylase n=1 Tax=Granulicella paludicola TaxID=474951 RepID=UPI0021DFBA46|nr:urate oxidase [Granulicella paludicola]
MPAKLAANRYGKSRVRVMRLTKHEQHHDLEEWTVQLLLSGDFETAHTLGDNSQILPTDTMKNTVYFVAHESKATSIEGYAQELIDYILTRNPQVSEAECIVQSHLWKRLTVDGQPYPTAFMHGSNEVQTTRVSRQQNGPFQIISGLDGLFVLKTAQSGFVGYIKDSLTTLPETTDRLFGTVVRADWTYTASGIAAGIDFNKVRTHLREAMLATFAKHDSLSVQQTLYAMGETALAHTDLIDSVYMLMPNKHNLLIDLKRFDRDNPNHIFVPTDEPHGTIEATIVRT